MSVHGAEQLYTYWWLHLRGKLEQGKWSVFRNKHKLILNDLNYHFLPFRILENLKNYLSSSIINLAAPQAHGSHSYWMCESGNHAATGQTCCRSTYIRSYTHARAHTHTPLIRSDSSKYYTVVSLKLAFYKEKVTFNLWVRTTKWYSLSRKIMKAASFLNLELFVSVL